MEVDPDGLPFEPLPYERLDSDALPFSLLVDDLLSGGGESEPPARFLRMSASISSMVRVSRLSVLRRMNLVGSKPALRRSFAELAAEALPMLLALAVEEERLREDLGLLKEPLEDLEGPPFEEGRGEPEGLDEADPRSLPLKPPPFAFCARASAMLPEVSSSSSLNMALRCLAALSSRET